MEQYDVVVIGGGWGGYSAAVRAAQHGLRTALVERDKLGGTCLHCGCIPTKVLLQTADLLALTRHAADFGVKVEPPALDFDRVRARMAGVVDRLYRGLQSLVRSSKADLIAGDARIAGPGLVTVSGHADLKTTNIIIATGSRPRPLRGSPFDGECVLSSDDLLRVSAVPRRMAVLGAGAVGVEFASCLADYGCDVTLIEAMPRITPLEDRDVSAAVQKAFTTRGITVITGGSADAGAIRCADRRITIPVHTQQGTTDVTADALLVAIGRDPVTDGLGLDSAGVAQARGFITVDEQMRTSAPGIYAVGDAAGGLLLAHVAAAEGVLAADTIAGHPSPPLDYRRLPRATYCRPQIASIGWTEEEAKERGYAAVTGRSHFRANGRALIGGDADGFVKLVADAASGDVLGVHIVGAHVTELIAEVALGALLDVAVWEVAAAVHPHPTLSEAIGEAAQAAEAAARRSRVAAEETRHPGGLESWP